MGRKGARFLSSLGYHWLFVRGLDEREEGERAGLRYSS